MSTKRADGLSGLPGEIRERVAASSIYRLLHGEPLRESQVGEGGGRLWPLWWGPLVQAEPGQIVRYFTAPDGRPIVESIEDPPPPDMKLEPGKVRFTWNPLRSK